MSSPASDLGRPYPGRAHVNLPAAALVEEAVRRNEGILTSLGAISCRTGKRTGRSPGDKFTVKDAETAIGHQLGQSQSAVRAGCIRGPR